MPSASKKLAEAAAWEYVRSLESEPYFTLSTILPPMIYGPVFGEPPSLQKLNTSSADIYRFISGTLKVIPDTPMPAFVDVRDVAIAHVRALQHKQSGRYLVSGGAFTYKEVCDILREELPEGYAKRIPSTNHSEVKEEDHYIVSSAKAVKELGVVFHNARKCFGDMGRKFVEMEQCEGIDHKVIL